MSETLDINAFLERSRRVPVLDVRTPGEYAKGHFPGAYNLSLFLNEERAEVGTLYKQAGREAAMLRGLDLAGPKLRGMVEAAQALVPGDEVLVHCWRGGMRSDSVAWLLTFAGYRVGTLRGGYKTFRRYVLDAFAQPRPIHLLGGMTGAGKTDVLRALAGRGEQVIDLEALACHKGSVFGHLGEPAQPSQEQFENDVAIQWRALDMARPVWIEDESRRIGRLLAPGGLWEQMQQAEVFVLDVPVEVRVERLVTAYGRYDAARLVEAIGAIGKRLGGLRAKQARQAVCDGALYDACRHLLAYYDTAYRHSLEKRNASKQHPIAPPNPPTPDAFANQLLEATLV